ncbi:MAG: hypothetical protein H7175_07580 [Burkholderiales bacterium]|nr:hypothetical protein [Anaerolineae bacterium]
MLLDKLVQQVQGFRQSGTTTSRGRERLTGQIDELVAEETVGLPLEVGNELLITADIVSMFSGLTNALGRVVIIDQIPTASETAIKASAFGIQVDVEMKVARHMRAAYLRREQAWS